MLSEFSCSFIFLASCHIINISLCFSSVQLLGPVRVQFWSPCVKYSLWNNSNHLRTSSLCVPLIIFLPPRETCLPSNVLPPFLPWCPHTTNLSSLTSSTNITKVCNLPWEKTSPSPIRQFYSFYNYLFILISHISSASFKSSWFHYTDGFH